MAVKGGFVAVPLPAVSAFPRWPCRSSAASPRENTPWKTLCPCAESRSNAEPLPHCPLPRNQARCVCTCAHAKFQPEESFIPDFYTLLPVGHTKSVPTETPVKRATPLPLIPEALGIILALELSKITQTLTLPKRNSFSDFSSTLGYFNPLFHRFNTTKLLSGGQNIASHLTDLS